MQIGDLVYSEVHGKWVRVRGVEPDGMVVVGCNVTGEILPDLVNLSQIRSWL